MTCTHFDRPSVVSLPSIGGIHVCRECYGPQETFIPQSWDHQCGPHDTSPDGRAVHYKEPTYEWRKK